MLMGSLAWGYSTHHLRFLQNLNLHEPIDLLHSLDVFRTPGVLLAVSFESTAKAFMGQDSWTSNSRALSRIPTGECLR